MIDYRFESIMCPDERMRRENNKSTRKTHKHTHAEKKAKQERNIFETRNYRYVQCYVGSILCTSNGSGFLFFVDLPIFPHASHTSATCCPSIAAKKESKNIEFAACGKL